MLRSPSPRRSRPPGQGNLADVLNALPLGALVDRHGFVVYCNHVLLRALGYESENEVFFMRTEELVHPSERARLTVEGTEAAAPQELRMIRRTGELASLEAKLVSIDFEDTPARLWLLHDLSERRRLEQRLLVADRMAALGTLSAGVAHEINTPLAYVLGNLEVIEELTHDLEDTSAPDALAELREVVREVHDGAARIQAVVRDLRNYAHQPVDRQPSKVGLPHLIDSVLRMAATEIHRRAKLVKELQAAPNVWANPQQLHQVLLNLVVNAAQAIPMGDVANNEVRVSTGTDASGRVLIEIADTGSGIEPRALRRIFDPFYTTKSQGEGTGLGLWICHTLISQMGGGIQVDSIVGLGTTFRVTLPAVATEHVSRTSQGSVDERDDSFS